MPSRKQASRTKQTINNTCGLHAIFHDVCNGLSMTRTSTVRSRSGCDAKIRSLAACMSLMLIMWQTNPLCLECSEDGSVWPTDTVKGVKTNTSFFTSPIKDPKTIYHHQFVIRPVSPWYPTPSAGTMHCLGPQTISRQTLFPANSISKNYAMFKQVLSPHITSTPGCDSASDSAATAAGYPPPSPPPPSHPHSHLHSHPRSPLHPHSHSLPCGPPPPPRLSYPAYEAASTRQRHPYTRLPSTASYPSPSRPPPPSRRPPSQTRGLPRPPRTRRGTAPGTDIAAAWAGKTYAGLRPGGTTCVVPLRRNR